MIYIFDICVWSLNKIEVLMAKTNFCNGLKTLF
jgi:hypothetical protein